MRTVAVIDFRAEELSAEFRGRFEEALAAALRGSGVSAKVRFRTATLPRATFAPEIASLEAERPDIYYATTTNIARQIREINPQVPIVFSGIVDPRAACLVRSIERPESNMTGFVSYEDIDAKRLELLADLSPRIRRIGVIVVEESSDCDFLPSRPGPVRPRGVEVIPLFVSADTPPGAVSEFIAYQRLDALDAPTSVFVRRNYPSIIRSAREARIPLSFRGSGFVQDGGVLSYEPREFDYPVKAAELVARVLQGVRPEDIPIEFPSEFILSINLSGVAALPYAVSKHVLRRANRLYP